MTCRMHSLASGGCSRREVLLAAAALMVPVPDRRRYDSVATLLGTGEPGFAADQVNNPYGLALGPDGALYFCDLGNQRIRRIDLATRQATTVAGNGVPSFGGDGGAATDASLNMPHEVQFDRAGHLYVAERDNHVVRRIDGQTGIISTLAGTGRPGFSGDGGPAHAALLRQPHSIAVTPDGRSLLVCDTGNHRVRRIDLESGVIDTIGGTGARDVTPDGAPMRGTPLNGPRTLAFDASGHGYLALREGNAVFRIEARTAILRHVAGSGARGYAGDGGPARSAALGGPKGLAWWNDRLFVADTENHVIRCIDLRTGVIDTVLGSGHPGDGPGPDPRRCALSRPHGVLVDPRGVLYVADSEAHRVRVLRPRVQQ